MHNLGRTYFSPNTESERDDDPIVDEFDNESDGYADEASFSTTRYEHNDDDYEGGDSLERPFSEEEELELAAELLEIEDEEQLDEFLGNILGRVARRVGKRRPKAGRVLERLRRGLKRVASVVKKALPVAGAIAGGPLAGMAMGALGMELEGLDPDERELEIARRYVRLSGAAAHAALAAPAGPSDAQTANSALDTAARIHVPGLLPSSGAQPVMGRFELHGTVPGQRVLVIRGI